MPSLIFRLAELRVFRCNNEVAEHREFAAAAKGETADSCYDRLGDGSDLVPRTKKIVHVEIRKRLLRHFRDIRTGRECTRAAGDHNRPDLIVGVERLQRRQCLDRQLTVQGVQALRSVQGNEADTVAALDDNRLRRAIRGRCLRLF
jgi:hypothetical protein